MSDRPRLLDLFCGAGGASYGYHRAGFDVTGIDHNADALRRYPFLNAIEGDVLLYLADLDFLRSFDAIHASPPCQAHSSLRHIAKAAHPDLIEPVRAALVASGRPYVIENVEGAPLVDPITLCGTMFDLSLPGGVLKRHRLFESNVPIHAPQACRCAGKPILGVYGSGGAHAGKHGTKVSGQDAADLMDIYWTNHQPVLAQAIPPAYTLWLGDLLLRVVEPV